MGSPISRKPTTVSAGDAAIARALSSPEASDQLRLLIDSVQDYEILTLDTHGVITSWNAGAQRLKGWKAEEIIGQHFSRFYPPEDLAWDKPGMELEVAAREGRFEDEGWRVRKDGTRFWANVVITALRDPDGRLRGYGKVTRDFTERKMAEEELRQSEERFRLIVDSVRDYAIFMLDPKGHVATWNQGAQRIKGYSADEIIGSHFSRFYPAEDLAWDKPAMELEVATREGRFEDEGWRIRKDGSRFWANVIITALRDKTGELRGFAKVTRDFTDRKHAEEQRELHTLREAVRARDEFLSVASHELKTPLTPIQLKLSGLLLALHRNPGESPPAARLERDLEMANRQVRKLSDLIEELLDVSRINSGPLRLDPAPMELGALAREVVARYAPQASALGSSVELHCEGPVQGTWDRRRLEQVVTNLLSNAIKYGAGQPIRVEVAQEGTQAVLRVADRGIGILPEHLPRIFDRFVRGVSERNFGGLGLGLFIAHQITEVHGGTIEVQSAPNEGSTFTMRLPPRPPPPAVMSSSAGS
ncbi:PAS domain-containing sensor histidine kinase [Aggregicoccus sp. 17bor-14]|nr:MULTISPECIES: PAS domain-containing sensor histidine kinase [Myxococcaceae]MBF5042371.1 PAS domain-containing sensor histidine kinase [Simulacricoccus sp. 17bor-14]MRI88144.1 PAS domain-containing sensor histidine kinase [Aggregicoccus sp. 17bor-14]